MARWVWRTVMTAGAVYPRMGSSITSRKSTSCNRHKHNSLPRKWIWRSRNRSGFLHKPVSLKGKTNCNDDQINSKTTADADLLQLLWQREKEHEFELNKWAKWRPWNHSHAISLLCILSLWHAILLVSWSTSLTLWCAKLPKPTAPVSHVHTWKYS